MSGHYSYELAAAAGETYLALDRERRDWWDDLSRAVEQIVVDACESVAIDGYYEIAASDLRKVA